jgi:hypothetical protein
MDKWGAVQVQVGRELFQMSMLPVPFINDCTKTFLHRPVFVAFLFG